MTYDSALLTSFIPIIFDLYQKLALQCENGSEVNMIVFNYNNSNKTIYDDKDDKKRKNGNNDLN